MSRNKIMINMLLLTMLVGIALIPAVSAATNNENSDIMNNIDFDKTSLKFNEILDNFETVTTNTTAFLNDIPDGQVTLKISGQKFQLDLQEIDIVSDDAIIITENGSRMPAPKISTYKGTVVGKENSSVLLTVADDVIIGQINVGDKSYFIEQTPITYNEKIVHVVYSSDAIKDRKILVYNTDGDDVKAAQEGLSTSSLDPAQISTLLLSLPVVDIMACYDEEFDLEFSSPNAEMQNILAGVESIFSLANVDLNIKSYTYYSTIPNDEACEVLSDFASIAANDRDSTNSDLAFLFTGKEMTGSDIGCARVFNGNSGQAYAVGQMVSAGYINSYQATSLQKIILTAHELGHNFGATHDEAYSWDSGLSHYYTVMWTPFMGSIFPNYMQDEFSNLNDHGDSSHNNILYIVANKNTIAGFQ
ncbi:M12 family metallo-peptidase [Methanosarcina mazei]|uniref:Peptidase M12B domain-containing protein n=1 Tax=Methanosarcina mazei TaxID=2209 RepID=A0A0F8GK23_METMZ|nr:M12 family metallo-peptidase [Methanosarcina mazei]KKF99519.1 hypothetical protein DU47_00730 [Methanosarcina mazei]KKG25875.1 hypothetical protein DU52_04530 [Methanosarcina mazei]KKG32605.1 hypothetical protein DU30_18175 [Methanosarcina mazei]KKG63702.1 hypothetical protein DU67_00080 [Methanosarcina mazei]KKG72802.1 hypothetical protein DU63_17035 [Methanosarcina mazei]